MSELRQCLIIRHGATHLNSNDPTIDRIRGWTDWPLSDEGRGEARKLADAVKLAKPDMILSSDLFRAEQTAAIVSEITGIPKELGIMAFRPWNVGDFVGEPAAEAVPVLADYAAVKPDQSVPGGESFNEFRYRFFNGLLAALYNNAGLVGIVTHPRNERLLKAWIKAGARGDGKIDPEEFALKGATTGRCEIIAVPMDSLSALVRASLVNLHLARRTA